VQRDAKEVMAEVLRKLSEKVAVDAGAVSGEAKENRRGNRVRPNLDRVRVGVDAYVLTLEDPQGFASFCRASR